MNASGMARQAWQRLGRDSVTDRMAAAVVHPGRSGLIRSGVAAGATLLALSAASAATSAIRRKEEGS